MYVVLKVLEFIIIFSEYKFYEFNNLSNYFYFIFMMPWSGFIAKLFCALVSVVLVISNEAHTCPNLHLDKLRLLLYFMCNLISSTHGLR